MNLPADAVDCDVVLRDGSTLALRKAGEGDAETVLGFLRGLSSQSQYQRFLGTAKLDLNSARRLMIEQPGMGLALLGACGGRVVAMAGLYKEHPQADRAEVAFAIADDLQGRGVGTRMLERLAEIARDQGIRVFDAFVLADNRRMLDVFTDSGFGALSTIERGVVHVTLSLEPTDAYVERSAMRAQTAATASLRPFFAPRGVAVIGASRSRGRIGSEILHNLIASGFRGALYPVHPAAGEIQGLRALLLSHQPLPRGGRVAILTNAGGPGILAADACEGKGLEMAALSDATRAQLRAFLPTSASVGNPVDMLASAPAEHYRQATAAVLADEAVDSLLVIFIPPLVTEPEAVAGAIVDGSRAAGGKPVLGVFMRAEGAPGALAPIPCYPFPESAAIALSRVTAYSAWRHAAPAPVVVPPAVAASDARQVVADALARGGGWLDQAACDRLMAAIGVATPPLRVVRTGDEAALAAREIGFPVAVKALGPSLLHKTERRAVVLGLQSPRAVWDACLDLTSRLGSDVTGFLVQQMVPGGVEMLVGVTLDPVFGHLVVCGSGGVLVDVFADSAVRLHPLAPSDAVAMVNSLKGVRLLRGYRGAPRADEGALRDVLIRVSAMLDLCPEIVEMDINPLKVLTSGASAVDVRIEVHREEPGPATRRIAY